MMKVTVLWIAFQNPDNSRVRDEAVDKMLEKRDGKWVNAGTFLPTMTRDFGMFFKPLTAEAKLEIEAELWELGGWEYMCWSDEEVESKVEEDELATAH